MCLTYPFTEQGDERFYVRHYHWIPYVFGLILFLFVLLELIVRKVTDPRVEKFLSKLADMTGDEERYTECCRYFTEQIGRHGGLVMARFKVRLTCLVIHVLVFITLNITLSGFYFDLYYHLSDIRDIENLSDPLSIVMPPFVQCELSP